jgi:hypothetical protein
MKSQEKAELLFKKKREQFAEGQIATTEYEQRAERERQKTARLRTMRLAREAQLVPAQAPSRRRQTKVS